MNLDMLLIVVCVVLGAIGVYRSYAGLFLSEQRNSIYIYTYTVKIILLISILYFVLLLFLSGAPLRNTTDTLFVLDVSKSMDVVDVSSDMEMISRSQYANDFIRDYLPYVDRYGIIAFADNAQVLLPLTDDVSLALIFLENARSLLYLTGGSDIASALRYTQAYIWEHGFDGNVVLITDGWEEVFDMQDFATIDTDAFETLQIYGVGSKTGGIIPDGVDASGNTQPKIYQWEEVISQRNDVYLQAVADLFDAPYKTLDGSDASNQSMSKKHMYTVACLLLMYMLHCLALPIFSSNKHVST